MLLRVYNRENRCGVGCGGFSVVMAMRYVESLHRYHSNNIDAICVLLASSQYQPVSPVYMIGIRYRNAGCGIRGLL